MFGGFPTSYKPEIDRIRSVSLADHEHDDRWSLTRLLKHQLYELVGLEAPRRPISLKLTGKGQFLTLITNMMAVGRYDLGVEGESGKEALTPASSERS